MPLTKKEVFAYIKSLSSGELSQFITELQEELGVEPPAPEPIPPPEVVGGYHPTMGFPEFDVYLVDLGANKLHALKTLREITGLGLLECKALVSALPKKIKESLSKSEAEEITKALKECGAIVEVR